MKTYEPDTIVGLINPVVDTVANATFLGADVSWYIKADDIRPKGQSLPGKAPDKKNEAADRR